MRVMLLLIWVLGVTANAVMILLTHGFNDAGDVFSLLSIALISAGVVWALRVLREDN